MTGPRGYWERKREEKQRFRNLIWFAVGLISHCIILSWKSHWIELENTCENTMNSENFRKSSQRPGYGQSLAVGWNHSVPIFPCHWGLISPINFFGMRSSLPIFLTPRLWHFWSSLSMFSAHAVLCSLFLLPCTGAENFFAAEAPVTTAACEDNCLCTEKVSSFPSSWSILSAPLRTHDSSVEKSCWICPDKAKEICLSKSEVRKSSLAYGFMTLTKSFSTKAEATKFCIVPLRRQKTRGV